MPHNGCPAKWIEQMAHTTYLYMVAQRTGAIGH